MKFALIELKLSLINIVKYYEIQPNEFTKKSVDFKEGIVRNIKDEIIVTFKKRNLN